MSKRKKMSSPLPMSNAMSISDIREWLGTNANNHILWTDINGYYATKPIHTNTVKNVLELPHDIHVRLNNIAKHFTPFYIHFNGLFVAPSKDPTIGPNELSVFTWIDLSQDELLTNYIGRIWNSNTLDLYYALYPDIVLKKQRYLFNVDLKLVNKKSDQKEQEQKEESGHWVSDPTDMNGDLFNVRFTGNIAPYFNEPPFGKHANCKVEWSIPSDSHNNKLTSNNNTSIHDIMTLSISTCHYIPMFSELFFLYETQSNIKNGIGEYELRNYLVGEDCQDADTFSKMGNIENFIFSSNLNTQQELIHQKYNSYINNEQNRLSHLSHSNEFKESQAIWLRPERVTVSSSSFLVNDQRYVWDWSKHFVFIQNPNKNGDKPYLLMTVRDLPAKIRLPIFGAPISEEEYAARETLPNRAPFLIETKVGKLDSWIQYHTDTKTTTGGDGAFIWIWIDFVSREKQANLSFDSSGYFVAKRKIKANEILSAVRSF